MFFEIIVGINELREVLRGARSPRILRKPYWLKAFAKDESAFGIIMT